MNEVRQCHTDGDSDYGAVAVQRVLDNGDVMWMIAHPFTGGRWATPQDVENIRTWRRPTAWEEPDPDEPPIESKVTE